MRRRIVTIAAAVVVLTAVAVSLLRQRAAAPAQADGPVIIFSIDTLRADWLPVSIPRDIARIRELLR